MLENMHMYIFFLLYTQKINLNIKYQGAFNILKIVKSLKIKFYNTIYFKSVHDLFDSVFIYITM